MSKKIDRILSEIKYYKDARDWAKVREVKTDKENRALLSVRRRTNTVKDRLADTREKIEKIATSNRTAEQKKRLIDMELDKRNAYVSREWKRIWASYESRTKV
jgi:hypothetical protein